jgi:hypothetical protein
MEPCVHVYGWVVEHASQPGTISSDVVEQNGSDYATCLLQKIRGLLRSRWCKSESLVVVVWDAHHA